MERGPVSSILGCTKVEKEKWREEEKKTKEKKKGEEKRSEGERIHRSNGGD
jgi:hypothetical protein